MSSLLDTIKPNSDQLNADDLIAGPITVQVVTMKRGPSEQQPVEILFKGYQPYRPCKSMRRVLIAAWGDNGKLWVGRSMTLFNDPSVRYGGQDVGGIRISHLSDIDKPFEMALTVTRGKRAKYKVLPLPLEARHAERDGD